MKIISIFFILISFVNAQEKLYLDNYWKKLLHVENTKSNIVSEQFFLSNSNSFSLEDEFIATVKLLRGENGKEIACNFPARYTWLKEHLNIPTYNLESCTELSNFMSTLQKDSIYLVFSSEYPNAPSSSFGHLMLAFKDHNMPLELSDVIHFAAKTGKDGFFAYGYKGLSGKYDSYFLRSTLFQKMYQYNIKEQRYIYAYQLDLTQKEIKKIQYHLFELRKATFKYYFLNKNCASQIIDVLEVSNENKIIKKSIFHLPIDTLKIYKDNIKNITKFTPLISKIDYLMKKMSPKEKSDFLSIIKTNATPLESLSNITKETLVYYYQFLFRKYHQSYSNYDDVMKLTYKKTKIEDSSKNPLLSTQPSKIGVKYYSTNRLELNYRPLFLDYHDIQTNPMQEVEFNLLNFNLSLKDNNLDIENIDLLNIKSLPIQYDFYHPLSWSLYFGFNRDNYLVMHLKLVDKNIRV